MKVKTQVTHGEMIGFSENEVSGHRVPHQLLEKTIKEIINDSAERKSEYIAKFWVNICLTSNSDIDESTAFSYFEVIESLSWRQLCILRLAILLENQEVVIGRMGKEITTGTSAFEILGEWFVQMPQNEQTRFYSFSRDFKKLVDADYIQCSGFMSSDEFNEPCMLYPGKARLTDYTKRLHSLMNLDEIPIKEIEETFSIWDVKRKKSE